ncbi:hypothetical protein ASC75_14180 [Aminobacter sp. DSM 101952]|nr:hypothetical protein ASC75_14180 [Aminobacter sp. DSM 101952]
MDEWVRPALSVDWRAACLPESHSFIEANSLIILFVDIRCHSWMKREAVAHKRSTDAGSAMSGIDEQRLHMSIVDQHEGQRVVIFVNPQPEWGLGKEATHHIVNGEAILRRQKIMRRVNCASPDFDDAVALTGAGTSDHDHGLRIRWFGIRALRRSRFRCG